MSLRPSRLRLRRLLTRSLKRSSSIAEPTSGPRYRACSPSFSIHSLRRAQAISGHAVIDSGADGFQSARGWARHHLVQKIISDGRAPEGRYSPRRPGRFSPRRGNGQCPASMSRTTARPRRHSAISSATNLGPESAAAPVDCISDASVFISRASAVVSAFAPAKAASRPLHLPRTGQIHLTTPSSRSARGGPNAFRPSSSRRCENRRSFCSRERCDQPKH